MASSRGQIMLPELPSFAEPEDRLSGARLPPALVDQAAHQKAAMENKSVGATISDVNQFTQEKMRGDAYIRLLIKPEAVASQTHIIPYAGDVMVPDTSLVMGATRPHLVMPPRQPEVDEEGNLIEDEEFADFERNDSVAFSFVRHNRYDAVENLIQQNTDIISAKDPMGNSLLHVACQNNNRRIVKMLVKNGVKVDAQNDAGNTPLHYCCQYGFMQLADFLISSGADEAITNQAGYLPSQGVGKSNVEAAQGGLRAGGGG
jgi:hypothetical protein